MDNSSANLGKYTDYEAGRLSSLGHWSQRWEDGAAGRLQFDPRHLRFRDIHDFFQKWLPQNEGRRLIELGAYPGKYLWYFSEYFDYEISGLEYVGWCCSEMEERFTAEGLPFEVIQGDMFDDDVRRQHAPWDVVVSFGLIEHFEDTEAVVRCHLRYARRRGLVALVVPNHAGLNGRLLRAVDREKYEVHNRMGLERLVEVISQMPDSELLAARHLGRFGLWNTGLYARVDGWGRIAYVPIRGVGWCAEHVGRLLSPNPVTSPYFGAVLRRTA